MKTKKIPATHLRLGLERLGASPHGSRYAYYAEEISETLSVTPAEVRLLGRMIADGNSDAYSEWCAATPTRRARG